MVKEILIRIRKDQYETLDSIKKQLVEQSGKRIPICKAIDVLANGNKLSVEVGRHGRIKKIS